MNIIKDRCGDNDHKYLNYNIANLFGVINAPSLLVCLNPGTNVLMQTPFITLLFITFKKGVFFF